MARADVYSRPLLHMHAGATQEYTVEAGFIVVVRCVTLFNASVLVPESGQLTAVDYDLTVAWALMDFIGGGTNQQSISFDIHYAALPGEVLRLSGDSDVDGSAFGYLLTLP